MSPQPSSPSRLIPLLALALLASGAARAQSVLPNGGHVVAGGATIGPSTGNNLAITQTTPRAVVDWNGFSVGPPNAVTFSQPGSTAAILNRVTGSTPSTIAGQIDANGQVYLVNPNGIAIAPTGNVQVGGGFVASTLGISNQDFMGGNLSFTGNGASAPVGNAGTIAAGPGGFVGLIGGTAANSGTISVPLGRVGLGSGEAATLDLNGGGFLQVAAPTGATTAEGQALVSNSGKIAAAGGTVELRAATVATAIRDAVNMSGVVTANSVSGQNGSITLSGGPGGAVNVSGTLNASAPATSTAIGGPAPTGTGGTVKVTGNSVDLAPVARVLAKGPAGGGTVEIGGGPHGADSALANAQSVTVEAGALVDASATGNGNGGTVSVWSDGTTVFNGTILATGGPRGGNGGWVETSGLGILSVGPNASVSAAAPHGTSGQWLLDPDSDILITNSGGESVTCAAGSCSPNSDSSILYASTIESALNAGTSVTVMTSNSAGTQQGNITVGQTAGSTDGTILLTSNQIATLTLDAGAGGGAGSITINSPISDAGSGGGALSLVLSAPQGGIAVANAITLAGSLTANAGAGAITVSAPIAITAGGAVSLDYSGSLSFTPTLGSLQFTGGSGAGASLSINSTAYTLLYDLGNDPTGLPSMNGSSGNFALAVPIDASNFPTSSGFSSPVVGSFSGAFNGLGNTISNLTITDNSDGAVGLFGVVGSGGAVSNIGLVGGSVTGAASSATIGELVGDNSGAIANAYATGTVNGGSGSTIDGGLVGSNESTGTITRSYATGAVNGGAGNAGGLVGQNIVGAISDSYATGAVSGGSGASVGGLVGYNFVGAITTSYASGAVSGGDGASVGGLAGTNFFGTIIDTYATGVISGGVGALLGGLVGQDSTTVTNGYYDAGTTGMPLTAQGDGSVGLTTAALQSFEFADTAYFQNNASWGIIPGVSYPYLKAFYPSTPQVVSGTVFQDQGSTPAGPGIAVAGLVGGLGIGTVTTGANGYYYYLLPSNTIPSGGGVLTYAQNYTAGLGTASGVAFVDGVSGAATGVTILADTLHEITPDIANSTLQANLATAVGGNTLPTGLTNLQIDASGGVFDIDTAISYPGGTVTLNAAGAITESAGTITASSLAVNAALSVDLPQANAVGTLVANVTGPGATFDFSNAQPLTIGTVGSLAGVTTDGTDGSAANIVLRTTVGDLDIEEPVSTNGANGSVLGLSQGLIGLQAVAGNIVMNQSGFDGYLVGYGIEAIATGNIILDGSFSAFGNRLGGSDDLDHVAQTPGTFAALATGGGSQIVFNTGDAPLTVGTVGVSAGSITLPTTSGVTSNGGEIDLSATFVLSAVDLFGVTLNQPVNANNFLSGGGPTTVLQGTPGLVRLVAEVGDITQSANGVILAGQLEVEAGAALPPFPGVPPSSTAGNVTLTAANRIGANDDVNGIAQTAGVLAGFANGDFKFVNHNAPLTVGQVAPLCGCVDTGIQTNSGDIDLATTGAGAIEVDDLVLAGNNVNIAVAPGNGFTNATGFGSGIGAFGAVTILADQMNLSGGEIVTPGGIVVLAPATPTDNIVLGGPGGPRVLSLQQVDLDSIQSGAIQIGYRNVDGTPSLTSNITIASDITIDTDFITGLLLVTGGSITEAGGGIIGTGSFPLQLGIMASGTNTLTAADNNIGRLAAYIDGTDPGLSFTNAARLRVGTLDGSTAGIDFDGDGFPVATPISGTPSDPLSGITTAGGASTTGGVILTTTTGGITVSAPISAGAQPIELTAAGTIAFNNRVTTTGALTATAGTDGGGGEGITQNGSGLLIVSGGASFTDQSSGGAIALTDNNSLGGAVSLNTTGTGGTATLVNGIALTLGASTLGDGLTVSATDGITVTGAVSSPGTIALNAIAGSGTGPMIFASGADVAAPTINLNATSIALTGTAILGQTGATIDLANTSSTGGVTEDTTAQIIAASLMATNGLTGAANLVGTANAIQFLAGITVSGSGNGFALVTATPLSVVGALTTDSGPVSLTTTGTGSTLSFIGDVSAPGQTVTLTSSERIDSTNAAVITAGVLTGSSVGGTQLPGPNKVTVFGPFTDTAGEFIAFNNAQSFAVAGTLSSQSLSSGGGQIILSTSVPGANLTFGNGGGAADGTLSTTEFVQLLIDGTITQASGTITGSSLEGSSVGGASLTKANVIAGSLGPFTNTGSGDVSFTNSSAIVIAGVTNTVGNITLTTTSGDMDLVPSTALSASPTGTVTLVSGGGIAGLGSSGTYATISGGSLSITAAGSVDLPGANTVNTLAANVTGAGASFDFSNAQTLTVGTVGGLSGVTTNGTDGSEANIVLQTTVGDLNIDQPVSTNGANGTVLGLSLGEIGLQAAGQLILNKSGTSGNLVGFAVEAIAGGTLNLDGEANPAGNRIGGNDVGGTAQTAGTFSGETTGTGAAVVFSDTNAPLTIDQVSVGSGIGVAAGSLGLPLISGVYSNGGAIALGSLQSTGNSGTFGLTLNQPVNANNFLGGFPSTALQGTPGLVQLYADAGDVTQSSSGVVLAGQLLVNSFGGSVLLTAANRIGANDNGSGIAQTAGILAGSAEGDFKFVNHNAPLTIDAVGCTGCEGIFAVYGSIDLATTGAGAITVNKPVNSGDEINIAVAPGYGFTNNASDDPAFDTVYGLPAPPGTAGLDTSYAGAPIIILADQISLAGGTINTGGGALVLGPATPTTNIVLAGGTVPAGTLGLQTADFGGVQAGLVQIGYRNPDGTVSMTGNITVAGNLAINTGNIAELLLMTGGSVVETGSGAITGTGSGSLQLGIIASGATNLNGANNIGTLAAYIDGTNPTLSFTNAGALTAGTLGSAQAGVSLDTDGFPNPTPLAGAAANPMGGITAGSGVTLTTGGNLTLTAPVSAPGQAVTFIAGGTITEDSGATITAASFSGSSVGNATLTEANAVGSLGPFTATGGALAFDDTVNLTIGGALSGTSIVVATIGPDPNLVISANMTAPTVALSATGSITQNSDTTIAATNLTAATQLDAGGAIALGSATNAVTGDVTLTSLNFAGTQLAGGAIAFNDSTGFTIASLGGLQGGVGTNGAASLTAGGTIAEASGAAISAGTLSGGSAGGATLTGANLVANLGSWTDTGTASAGLTLADGEALTVAGGSAVSSTAGPVTLAVSGGDLTLGASSTVSGNGIVLATTGDFINNAGAGALTPNAGSRWLVYSAAPAGDSFGNLDSGNTAIWNATYASLPPASVTPSGNRYLFAQGQTLSVTTISDSKTYGTDATAQVASDFNVTGYATGVTNAYLGDTAATAYTGAPSVTSTGSAPTATVAGGPYSITLTAGTMAGADGYAVTLVSGGATLTVNPATLTAGLAGSVSKVYDGTNVAALATGNYTLTGIVNGDTVTLNDPTAGIYATPNAGTGIGVAVSGLAISGSGVGNYTLASTTASANIGTITPALLTAAVTGNPSKTYDGTAEAPLVPGNFTLAGFVTGEGATLGPLDGTYASVNVGTGIAVSAVLTSGDYTANAGTLLANYTLPTSAAGTGAIAAELLTVTANNLTRQTGQPNPALTYALTAGTLFGGDTLSGAVATTAIQTSPAGAYSITEGTLAAPSTNYALTFVDGVLTIIAPHAGASPLMYVSTDWGWLGNAGAGGGTIPGLTTCSPGSIAAQLHGDGHATLYGGSACGSP